MMRCVDMSGIQYAPLLMSVLLAVSAPDADARQVLELFRASTGGDVNNAWNFPELRRDSAHPDARDPCKRSRIDRVSELESPWRSVVKRITWRCTIEPGTGVNGDALASFTEIHAVLRPGMVTFGGVPVAEVVRFDSESGADYEYVLQQSYATSSKSLRAMIEKRVGASMDLSAQEGGKNEGLVVNDIWLHPDAKNVRRTVFSVSWSE